MKDFKVGKYYIFNKNGEKIGKAKIHALVQIDGILHAVFTYYLVALALKHVGTLPVEIEEETQTIHFGEAGYYLSATAPVPLKPAKFKTGKKYYDYGYEKFEVLINAKYKDPADNKVKVILNGATISEVFTDNEGNERATILDDIVKAEDEVKE